MKRAQPARSDEGFHRRRRVGGHDGPQRGGGDPLGNRALTGTPSDVHLHTGREQATHVRAAAGAEKGHEEREGREKILVFGVGVARARFRSRPGPRP